MFLAHLLVRTVSLFVFWFLLSGKTQPFYLISGLLCSWIVAWISLARGGGRPTRLSWPQALRAVRSSLQYSIWLMIRIAQAALHVSKLILDPSLPIRPKLIRHKTSLIQDNAKVIFANSITLTPGTITADLSGSTLLIHELDHDSAGDILSGGMENEISKIFKKG